MKPFISSMLALAAFPLSAVAGGTGGAVSEASVVVRMVESFTAPATFERDDLGRYILPRQAAYSNVWSTYDRFGNLVQENEEYLSRVVTYRISNREILELLVSEGVIPSIAGWSIKAVYGDDADSEPRFYLTRPGFQPVDIAWYLSLEGYGQARADRVVSYTRYYADGSSAEGGTDQATVKSEASGYFTTRNLDPEAIEEEGTSMFPSGLWNRSVVLRGFGRGADYSLHYVYGPGSLSAISGSILDVFESADGFDYYDSVLEGSWSFSAARLVTDTTLFPEVSASAARAK